MCEGRTWTPATAWMDLEDVTLNEISQTQKDTHSMTPLTRGTCSSEDRWWLAWAGEGDGEVVFTGEDAKGSAWVEVGAAQQCECAYCP